jgi:hypothetical protein
MTEVLTAKVSVGSRRNTDEKLLSIGEEWFGHRNLSIVSKQVEIEFRDPEGNILTWTVVGELIEATT